MTSETFIWSLVYLFNENTVLISRFTQVPYIFFLKTDIQKISRLFYHSDIFIQTDLVTSYLVCRGLWNLLNGKFYIFWDNKFYTVRYFSQNGIILTSLCATPIKFQSKCRQFFFIRQKDVFDVFLYQVVILKFGVTRRNVIAIFRYEDIFARMVVNGGMPFYDVKSHM